MHSFGAQRDRDGVLALTKMAMGMAAAIVMIAPHSMVTVNPLTVAVTALAVRWAVR
jgi:hypothetical protein